MKKLFRSCVSIEKFFNKRRENLTLSDGKIGASIENVNYNSENLVFPLKPKSPEKNTKSFGLNINVFQKIMWQVASILEAPQ